jgi:hypothetical protein
MDKKNPELKFRILKYRTLKAVSSPFGEGGGGV